MGLKIIPIDTYLFLEYIPERPNFLEELENREKSKTYSGVNLRNTFWVDYTLYEKSLALLKEIDKEEDYPTDGDEFYFLIGTLEKDFYKLDNNVLGLKFDLFFDKSIKIDIHNFVKSGIGYGYSVFKGFNEIYNGKQLYIVKEKNFPDVIDETLSLAQLKDCINLIPTNTEIAKYRLSRYTKALINYLDVKDKETEFNQYIKKKTCSKISSDSCADKKFIQFDKVKYESYLDKLKNMLENFDTYNENDWQVEILKIFKLLNPKYIYVGEKIQLTSFITQGNIYPDIVLVDNDGNIDLIEIKRPQYDIFYKNVYRNNYVPIRELQGTCMQLQNYLISLTKTSNDSLQQEKFKVDSNIPKDFQLKATSPKGYIIYGRDMQLEGNEKMLTDFQIVRNMYSNVIDIITYDDLIRRLENMLKALEVSL